MPDPAPLHSVGQQRDRESAGYAQATFQLAFHAAFQPLRAGRASAIPDDLLAQAPDGESLRIPCINARRNLAAALLPQRLRQPREARRRRPPGARSVKKASSFGQSRIASSIAGSLPGA